MFKPNRILVPVDFSSESKLALQWAVLLAKGQTGASIELCHIRPIIASVGPQAMAFDYSYVLKQEKNAIEKKLKALQADIPNEIPSSIEIGEGDIASEIERLCGKSGIELVIMTTHGRRGLSRFLHGSTTEETARQAPCPVLVLHLNEITRESVGATCEGIGEGWHE